LGDLLVALLELVGGHMLEGFEFHGFKVFFRVKALFLEFFLDLLLKLRASLILTKVRCNLID
jgi:hypothetical protein